MNTLKQAAYEYAERGWSVVPLQERDKRPWLAFPLTQYQRQRRATPEAIQTWWDSVPDANIAICTGQISGLFVVDCDTDQAIADLVERGLPNTLAVSTSNGAHFYFSYPDFLVGNRAGLLPDVDIRGDGGYVVAPPSVHPSGAVYKWVEGTSEVLPAPDWLLAMLRDDAPPVQAKAPTQATRTKNGHRDDKVIVYNLEAYLDSAFNQEIDALSAKGEGYRNDQLNASAFNLGQLVGAGVLSRQTVECSLMDVAKNIGLTEREAGATIASGLDDGIAQPREIIVRNGKPTMDKPIAPRREKSTKNEEAQQERVNLTDLGNAKRLVKRWGNRIRYVAAYQKWFVWDETRWQIDETGSIMRAAKDTVLSMYGKASEITDADKRQDWLKFAMGSESRSRLESMVALARSEKRIVVKAEVLDANSWMLNCRNVTIDLQNWKVKEHDPKDLITKRLDVTYDEKAKCPTWRKFLNRILRNDQELIEFIQRAVGYSLTGDVSQQCLFFMFGTGRNGKSTFIETLLSLFSEYGAKTPTETLMARDRSGVPNDVARLAGKRFVVARETDENQRLAEATIKDLTGGDKIIARFMYQEFFEFKPIFKIWMYGNHKPLIRGTDEGIWRRIKLIPFTVTIPLEERDPHLGIKLENELSGILNWALEGCKKWQDAGLNEPKSVIAATAEYRSEMDVLGAFLAEETVSHEDAQVKLPVITAKFGQWAIENGERAMTRRGLAARLRERGFQSRESHGDTIFVGLGLKSEKQ